MERIQEANQGFAQLTNISIRDKCLVSGYLREQQELFFSNQYKTNIYFNVHSVATVILVYARWYSLLNVKIDNSSRNSWANMPKDCNFEMQLHEAWTIHQLATHIDEQIVNDHKYSHNVHMTPISMVISHNGQNLEKHNTLQDYPITDLDTIIVSIELVELHFELEIDYGHAFQTEQVITGCIADVMNISKNIVYFDGVDELEKDGQFYGLFRGHLPTTKQDIETLVSIFYNSLMTNILQQKITDSSLGNFTTIVEIRELYETDFGYSLT